MPVCVIEYIVRERHPKSVIVVYTDLHRPLRPASDLHTEDAKPFAIAVPSSG